MSRIRVLYPEHLPSLLPLTSIALGLARKFTLCVREGLDVAPLGDGRPRGGGQVNAGGDGGRSGVSALCGSEEGGVQDVVGVGRFVLAVKHVLGDFLGEVGEILPQLAHARIQLVPLAQQLVLLTHLGQHSNTLVNLKSLNISCHEHMQKQTHTNTNQYREYTLLQ